jgi:hypothetical protein
MTIRIGNVHSGDKGEYVGRAIRGRKGSPLANPFPMQREADRSRVIAAYNSWLSAELAQGADSPRRRDVERELFRLRALAMRPEGVTLLCWCAPKPCHAEVIRDMLLVIGPPP